MSQEVISELIAAGDFLAMNGTDGMCRRWERAKAAYAATLRQQAGRVDEDTMCAMWIQPGTSDADSAAFLEGARRMKAALAQNTQGGGEAVAWVTPAGNVYWANR